MSETYEYSKECDPGRLGTEIDNSADITIAVISINNKSGKTFVSFKAVLSSNEKTALDTIVSNHVNEPLEDNSIVVTEVLEDRTGITDGAFQGNVWRWKIPAATIDDTTKQAPWYKLTVSDELTNGIVGPGEAIKFPFAISALFATWHGGEEFINDTTGMADQGRFVAGENTVIGVVTESNAVGTQEFAVSDTVIDNVSIGLEVTIDSEFLGRIIAHNKLTKTITTENASAIEHSIAVDGNGNPTAGFVKITKVLAKNIFFDKSVTRFPFGGNRVGGSLLPANTDCFLYYRNNTGLEKYLNLYIEYLM